MARMITRAKWTAGRDRRPRECGRGRIHVCHGRTAGERTPSNPKHRSNFFRDQTVNRLAGTVFHGVWIVWSPLRKCIAQRNQEPHGIFQSLIVSI